MRVEEQRVKSKDKRVGTESGRAFALCSLLWLLARKSTLHELSHECTVYVFT